MSPRVRPWWFDLSLVALALAAYSSSFSAGLIYDNAPIILNDPRVRAATVGALEDIFTGTYWAQVATPLYRPLTTLSYWFNYTLLGNGGSPLGYHVVNFLLHAGNVLLLRRLAGRIAGATPVAWIAAALLAVHPIGVEAVTNVVGRADLLATLAVLVTALAWLRAQEATDRRRATQWKLFGGVAAFCGVFCKETGVMAVAAVALLAVHAMGWRTGLRTFVRRAGLMVAPAFVAAIVVRVVAAQHALPVQIPFTSNPIADAGMGAGFMTAIGVMGRSVGLLLWPASLSCDYSYPQIVPFGQSGMQDAGMALSLAGLVAVGAWVFWRRRSWPVLAFGLGWALVMSLPTSNLLVRVGAAMAERFLYLPLTGFALAAAWVLWTCAEALSRRGVNAWILPGLCLMALAARTWVRNGDWRDERALWESAVQACPRSFFVYKGLAGTIDPGDAPTEADTDRAIAIAEKGIALLENPPLPIERQSGLLWLDQARRFGFKGDFHAARGEKAEAEAWYRRSLDVLARAEAKDEWSSAELRAAYARRGDAAAAARHYGDLRIPTLKAIAWRRLGQPREALAALQRLRQIEPLHVPTLITLADIDREVGDHAAVAARLLQVLVLDDHNALGWDNLIGSYRQRGISPIPVTREGSSGHLDLRHPQLRLEMNTAMADLVRSLRDAGQAERATIARERAIRVLGCPPEIFAP